MCSGYFAEYTTGFPFDRKIHPKLTVAKHSMPISTAAGWFRVP